MNNKNRTLKLTFISVFLLTIASQFLLDSPVFGISSDFVKGFMIGISIVLGVVTITTPLQKTPEEK